MDFEPRSPCSGCKKVISKKKDVSQCFVGATTEKSPWGIAIIQGGRIMYANSAACQMLGYASSREAVGRKALRHILERRLDVLFLSEGVRKGEIQAEGRFFEVAVLTRDKKILPFEVSLCFVETKCFGTTVFCYVRDLSKQKEYEAKFHESRHLSMIDSLTGLYNRRSLEESIRKEIARAFRHGYKIAFVMFDLDHFKRINDDFGHETGNEVIKKFSKILLEHIRSDDIACRYGGEEFLLVMPDIDERTAEDRAEKIRASAEKIKVISGEKENNISVSGGIAYFPKDAFHVGDLIKAADSALYCAKRAGRNLIRTYTNGGE